MATEHGTRADLMTWMRQTFCGLHGHDSYLQFERDRMFLKCVSCGHETHGWELIDAGDSAPARGETRRRVVPTPQLVGARRVA